MDEKNKKYRIAAVVVTYNRLPLLHECITALRNQSHKLDEIIIINNSSSDGTLEWLNSQSDLTVITQENSGSAGGQYTGIKTAYEKGYDWIWCMDGDIIPEIDALEMFIKSNEFILPKTGFMSSLVLDSNRNISYINIPYLPNEKELVMTYLKSGSFSIISGSFGSLLIKRKVISLIGFPNPKFFLWGDDVEYTFRIIKIGYYGYLIRSSVVTHIQKENNQNPLFSIKFSDKKYRYAIINTTYCILSRNKILKRNVLWGIFSTLKFLVSILKSNRINNPLKIFQIIKWWIEGITKRY